MLFSKKKKPATPPEHPTLIDQVDIDLEGYNQPDAEETRYFTLDGKEITEEMQHGRNE